WRNYSGKSIRDDNPIRTQAGLFLNNTKGEQLKKLQDSMNMLRNTSPKDNSLH
ncbi:hypothetical protein C922_03993, partial [Plasmodium inui San Antonio 1]